jgi:hypothetical protein
MNIKIYADHVEINGISYNFFDIPDEILNKLSAYQQRDIDHAAEDYLDSKYYYEQCLLYA